MSRVAIIGAGDFGQQIAHFISHYSEDIVAGYFDDFYEGDDPKRNKLGNISDISPDADSFDTVFLGIGYNHLEFKKELGQNLRAKGIRFYTFIHPSVIVDKTAKIGEGVVIYPGTVVDMHVQVEEHTVLNNCCTISHHSTIGQACFLAPGVILSGNCKIGDATFIGSGTTIIDGVQIESNIRIGAGALVTKNLETKGLYMGVPAKLKSDG